jgi:hypothetical protein
LRRGATLLCIATAALFLPLGAIAASPEPALSSVVAAIEANRPDLALVRVEKLLAEHPTFRLAHLIRGDLLLARSRPLQTFGNVVKTVPREHVEDLRSEALARLHALRERPRTERQPRALLQLHPGQKHALLIDSQRSRLYVYENVGGRPQYVTDYYVSLGKRGVDKAREGDQKTPIGVYHVTANLPRQKLTDFYGAGAYPINYPNEYDRQRGRNGYGIWVYGTPPDTYSRPPRASRRSPRMRWARRKVGCSAISFSTRCSARSRRLASIASTTPDKAGSGDEARHASGSSRVAAARRRRAAPRLNSTPAPEGCASGRPRTCPSAASWWRCR